MTRAIQSIESKGALVMVMAIGVECHEAGGWGTMGSGIV